MLIDWFTVVAQVVNFLILVWLLKRFLYRPILDAIDAREKRIARKIADADARKAEALKERDEFRHRNEEFDQQRAALLGKAADEAKTERQQLLEDARKAADAMTARRQESLKSDQQHLGKALGRRAREEVFAIARKALADLATTSLEERIGEVFIRRLRGMDGKARQVLGDALKSASAPGIVRSAFELPAEQRAAIQDAINKAFAADVLLRFETEPDLVSGIELISNGQKLGWSIADYLKSLERSIDEFLETPNKPDSAGLMPQAKTAPLSNTEAAPGREAARTQDASP